MGNFEKYAPGLNVRIRQALADALVDRGLSSRQLAETMGCSEVTLENWLQEPIKIPLTKFCEIIQILKIEREMRSLIPY